MKNKETIERNIGLTFDFVNYLIDNPEELAKLPEKFNLEFIDDDFSKRNQKQTLQRNQKLLKKYVRVKNSFDVST